MARVRAALRRHAGPEPFVIGGLAIDYERLRVTVAGNAVDLTATEYELLRALSLAGRVVTFETLGRVWAKRGNADAKLVRIFVRNLRRKLGDSAAEPVCLFKDRGVGYRMGSRRTHEGTMLHGSALLPSQHAHQPAPE